MEPQRAEGPVTGVREPPAVAGDVAKTTAGSIGNRRVGRLVRAGHGAAMQRALMGAGAPPPVGRRTLSRFELLEEAPTGGAAPGEAPVKLLRKGSAGSLVEELQGDLNAIAVEPALVVDGQFGGQMDLAVRFFQQAHRLVVDAIVGRETRSMLDREIALHGGAVGAARARWRSVSHTGRAGTRRTRPSAARAAGAERARERAARLPPGRGRRRRWPVRATARPEGCAGRPRRTPQRRPAREGSRGGGSGAGGPRRSS